MMDGTEPGGRADVITGTILGTAAGDALGLPRENLSARRANRLFGAAPDHYQFLGRRGMVSDDTEHTCMAGQALLESGGDPDLFRQALAARFRRWVLALPGGAGLATMRSSIRLCFGVSPEHSGVPSAGNGPAMRAAILGVCAGENPDLLRSLIRVSTRLTHTDPRAERGALAIALAAWYGASQPPTSINPCAFLETLGPLDLTESDAEWQGILEKLHASLKAGHEPAEFLESLTGKLWVSGYVYVTVPVALYCWLRSPSEWRTLQEAIGLGGDTDTLGAIVGGLLGATMGSAGIPERWIQGLAEWPRSSAWMRELGARLAVLFPGVDTGPLERPASIPRPLTVSWPAQVARNAVFNGCVLLHVARRALPPW